MPKCDFNSIAKQLYYNHFSVWVFCNFAGYFQNTCLQEHFYRTTSAYFDVFFRYGRRFCEISEIFRSTMKKNEQIGGIYIKV